MRLAYISIGMSTLLAIIWYFFGFTDHALIDSGEELLYGPIASVIVFILAVFAWLRAKQITYWHKCSLACGILVFIIWLGTSVMFYIAYSNCPDGVC